MNEYQHVVQYYETDKMGIAHHSNYVRWMEEARIDFLRQIGWPYDRLEKEGIISPVMAVECRYKKSCTFSDTIAIRVSVEEFHGVRLKIAYQMVDEQGDLVCQASSEHCFVNEEGQPIRLKRQFPELNQALESLCKENKEEN